MPELTTDEARAELLAFIGRRSVPASEIFKWGRRRGLSGGQVSSDISKLLASGALSRTPLDASGNASKSARTTQYRYELARASTRHPNGLTQDVYDTALHASHLTLLLGLQRRLTEHPDGTTESVTTHTAMLATTALALHTQNGVIQRSLDLAKLLAYAVVHDLAEAYAGDTPTLVPLTTAELHAKEQREREATARIHAECPELGAWIADYERQAEPESQFIYILDKVMPKLTVVLNKAAVLLRLEVALEQLAVWHMDQANELAARTGNNPAIAIALDLLQDSSTAAETTYFEQTRHGEEIVARPA